MVRKGLDEHTPVVSIRVNYGGSNIQDQMVNLANKKTQVQEQTSLLFKPSEAEKSLEDVQSLFTL